MNESPLDDLYRVLDGEDLDAAGRERLLRMLESTEAREAWEDAVRIDHLLGELRGPILPDTRSRQKLLAKSVLRLKRREHATRRVAAGNAEGLAAPRTAPRGRTAGPRRPVRSRTAVGWSWAALAAVVAIALITFWPAQGVRYPSPRISGDYHVLGPTPVAYGFERLDRGDRARVGDRGARLDLGGYCRIDLGSQSDVILEGTTFHEAIALLQGSAHCRITPGHGGFRVRTPLGSVSVLGTEFITEVHVPYLASEGEIMSPLSRRVVVTVTVLSGAVLCELGSGAVVVSAGESREFRGSVEDSTTRGVVTQVGDRKVTLRRGDDEFVFHAPESRELVLHSLEQLRPGDEVTIAWVSEGERKFIREIDGEGRFEGTVVERGDAWIAVRPEGQETIRLRAPWIGGNPADGGGPDKEVMRMIASAKPGARVAIRWAMPEGKRVVGIQLLESGSDSPEPSRVDRGKVPEGLRGLSGRVIGRLVSKDTEAGELTLEIREVDRVWRGNKAEDPQSAVGRTLKIEGVFGGFLDTLLTLREGDGVRIEVKHVDGDVLRFLGEGLEKVELPMTESPGEEPEESAGRTSRRTMELLTGFRGILRGRLVSKDVEAGSLVLRIDSVPRVWEQNRAERAAEAAGGQVTVTDISGRFLDVLLGMEIGDAIEVEAFEVGADALRFPGEWLRPVDDSSEGR